MDGQPRRTLIWPEPMTSNESCPSKKITAAPPRQIVDSFAIAFRCLTVIASFLATKIAYAILSLMGANPPPDHFIVQMSTFFGDQLIFRLTILCWCFCVVVSQLLRGPIRYSPWDILLLVTPVTLWLAIGIAVISAQFG